MWRTARKSDYGTDAACVFVVGGAQECEVSETALPEYPTRQGVIITISREHGSAGKLIGQLVAERMGIPCYYKEMIAIAAHIKSVGPKAGFSLSATRFLMGIFTFAGFFGDFHEIARA